MDPPHPAIMLHASIVPQDPCVTDDVGSNTGSFNCIDKTILERQRLVKWTLSQPNRSDYANGRASLACGVMTAKCDAMSRYGVLLVQTANLTATSAVFVQQRLRGEVAGVAISRRFPF